MTRERKILERVSPGTVSVFTRVHQQKTRLRHFQVPSSCVVLVYRSAGATAVRTESASHAPSQTENNSNSKATQNVCLVVALVLGPDKEKTSLYCIRRFIDVSIITLYLLLLIESASRQGEGRELDCGGREDLFRLLDGHTATNSLSDQRL